MKTLATVFLTIIVGIFLVYGCVDYLLNPDIEENVESVSWLPDEATNISYLFYHPVKAYEFEISEKGFLQWVKEKNVHKSELKIVTQSDETTFEEIERYNKTRVRITDGYFCQYMNASGNGGGYWMGYDKKTNRAYYFGSSH